MSAGRINVPVLELASLSNGSKVRALGALILAATVTAVVLLIIVANQGETAEQFTEFYLLGPDGDAEGYPRALDVGERASLTLGIVNREGKEALYRMATYINGTQVDEIDYVRLSPRQRWEHPVYFTLTQAGERQRVEFVLYLDGRNQAYRRLRLWVDGLETAPTETEESVLAEAEAPTAAEAAPAAATTPEPEAAPTPQPQYEIHIVVRGENLTFISHDYDVLLQAVIEANAAEVPNPDLIYPNQHILIPLGER